MATGVGNGSLTDMERAPIGIETHSSMIASRIIRDALEAKAIKPCDPGRTRGAPATCGSGSDLFDGYLIHRVAEASFIDETF